MGDVKIVVTVDEHGNTKKIKDFDKAIQDLATTTSDKATTSGDKFIATLGRMAGQLTVTGIALMALNKLKGATIDFFRSAVTEALKSEQSDMRLKVALETMGKARAGSVADMLAFAKAQSKITLYTDEEIASSAALLAQLTRLDVDGIKKAIPGIEGLASVLGPDEGGLRGATMMVVKAMEGNTAGLAKAGIVIDDTIPKGERLAEVQRRLAELFPRATAETETTAGAIKQASKAYDELMEKLGGIIAETFNFKGAAVEIAKALDDDTVASDAATESFLRLAAAGGRFRAGGFGFAFEDYAEVQATRMELERTAKVFDDFMTDIVNKGRGAGTTLINLGTYFKDLGIKSTAELRLQLDDATFALKTMLVQGDQAPGVIRAMRLKIEELTEALYPGTKAWNDFNKAGIALKETSKVVDLFAENLENLAIEYANLDETINWEDLFPPDTEFENPLQSFIDAAIDGARSTESAWTRTARKIQAAMEKIAALTGQMFAQLDATAAQAQRNREIEIDNEYKKRLDTINRTITDEDAKQKAIMALEAEYQIKKSAAQAAGAKAQKAIALAAATMNMAEAITAALTMKPWTPLNFALAAATAAAAAVQVGLIAAQPIPLAKGGYFKRPTIIPAMDRSYAIAEGGSAEVVSPVPILRQIVREEGGGRGVNVSFGPGAIAIYAQTLDDRTIDQAGAKIYRAVESRLRLRGRRL